MKSDMQVVLENLADDIEQELNKVVLSLNEGLDGEALLQICANHRMIAIGELLSAINLRDYYHNLYQSARAYIFLLEQSQVDKAINPYYLCKSRAQPLWDAITSTHESSVKEIVALSNSNWKLGLEDEADYRYYVFIETLLQSPASYNLDIAKEKLRSFENALGGESSPRLEISRALLEKNDAAFEEFLIELIEERDMEIEVLKESDSLSPEYELTEAFVFIEGIALVKIAKQLGMKCATEFRFIPDLTLMNPPRGLVWEDIWMELRY